MLPALKKTALAAALCCATGLFFYSGCGKHEPTSGTTPLGTPVASSGSSVVSGVVSVVSGGCNTSSGVLVLINTMTGNNVYTYLAPVGTSYEAHFAPGEYVLTCQAIPCTFSRQFTVTSGESLVIDPVL